MPELPEVETERRYLDAHARHQRVTGVRAPHPDVLSGTSAQSLSRRLKGHTVESSRRHGKYLFAGFDSGDWLAMHFGMTGSLKYYRQDSKPAEYIAVLLLLEGGHDLAYLSRRRLGRIALITDPDAFIAARKLGVDALEIKAAQFRELLISGRAAVKPRLMDQGRIAGIGNEYSDEILFQARIHPARSTTSLSQRESEALYRAMRTVLKKAIAVRADPGRMPSSWLYTNRSKGARCPVCGGPVGTLSAGGRTAYYCPKCQPRR